MISECVLYIFSTCNDLTDSNSCPAFHVPMILLSKFLSRPMTVHVDIKYFLALHVMI